MVCSALHLIAAPSHRSSVVRFPPLYSDNRPRVVFSVISSVLVQRPMFIGQAATDGMLGLTQMLVSLIILTGLLIAVPWFTTLFRYGPERMLYGLGIPTRQLS